jgi:anti-anti-sigma factor
MSVSVLPKQEDGNVIIKVSGEFTFTMQRDFRIAYETYSTNMKFKIDLSETTHIDSAGLGILMAMRSKLGGDQARIEICSCKPQVRDLMNIFHFDQYFRIS